MLLGLGLTAARALKEMGFGVGARPEPLQELRFIIPQVYRE